MSHLPSIFVAAETSKTSLLDSHTPQTIKAVLEFIHSQNGPKRESSDRLWFTFKLPKHEYFKICDQLKRAQIRYDYYPTGAILAIQMTTILHDKFAAMTAAAIEKKLHALANNVNPQTRSFINKIEQYHGSVNENSEGTKLPDSAFHHQDAQYPGVIIEVAYSQDESHLKKKAEYYFLDTGGNIKIVIGLILDYKGSKKAAISTWRLKGLEGNGEIEFEVVQELKLKLFRNKAGEAIGSGLAINLEDFAPKSITGCLTPGSRMVLSAEELCKLLKHAEEIYEMIKEKHGIVEPPMSIRRQLSPPPEVFTLEDEGRYEEELSRTEIEQEAMDSSFED